MTQPPKTKCLTCDRPAAVRGLCKSCYEIFRKTKAAAKNPEAFEALAIERKMISPEDKRRASNPFEELRRQLEESTGKEIAAEVKENYRKQPKKPKPSSE